MTGQMRVGKQDYTVTGRAGTFKVSLSWYGSQSAKRWEVILWRGRRVTWFGLFPRWRWRRIRTETNIRRLLAGRHVYEAVKEDAEALAAGPIIGEEAIA